MYLLAVNIRQFKKKCIFFYRGEFRKGMIRISRPIIIKKMLSVS